MSTSEELRKAGNALFVAASKEGLAPVIKLDKYEKSLTFYQKALNSAETDTEKSSASKNCAVVCHYIANYHSSRCEVPQTAFYFKECLNFAENAISHGNEDRSFEWINTVKTRMETVIVEIIDFASQLDYNKRISILTRLSVVPESDYHSARLLKEAVSVHFHQSIQVLSDGAYKCCLGIISDVYTPMVKVEDILERICDDEFRTELQIDEIKADIYKTQCIAESIQSRSCGDDLLTKTINNSEDLNMAAVWEVIDMYKQSILLTRENDVEEEAISLSSIGKVFSEVLCMKAKAKEYFMRSIQLAQSLQPRNFGQETWFKVATAAIAKYQQEELMKEEKTWQAKRKKYLDSQKKELDELKRKSELAAQQFLVWLYKTHPPKHVKDFKVDLDSIGSCKADKCKKLLASAIVHYHPDKINVDDYSMDWKVFSEEITKFLTQKYECFK